MNIIKTKKIIIFSLSFFAIVMAVITINNIMLYPNISAIDLSRINPTELSSIQVSNSQINTSTDSNFNYELVGFRLDNRGLNSSVIVKRNNQEFVIQKGDLLENKYLLTSVNKNNINFSYLGKDYQIENNLTE
jgi:acid phosphatase class B